MNLKGKIFTRTKKKVILNKYKNKKLNLAGKPA